MIEPIALRQIDVLGTDLAVTSYSQLADFLEETARSATPFVVDFSNTHIVTLRRSDPAFHAMTACVDLFVPDGMPLVWTMNLKGAKLKDRVYGPTFMRHFMSEVGDSTHYLLGGSPETGEKLTAEIARWNSRARVVGAFHGQCSLDGQLEDDERIGAQIAELAPDYLWVGLGTPKQYAWIERNKRRLRRGVVFAIGFGFDVNAGTKRDAPPWMQRFGLTWLFRLATEPRRLWKRYLVFNSLFVFYLVRDFLNPRTQ